MSIFMLVLAVIYLIGAWVVKKYEPENNKEFWVNIFVAMVILTILNMNT